MSEPVSYPSVQVQIQGSVARVTLDRPDVHNAFDAGLIASLTAVFRDLSAREDLRAVILGGAGPSFCAGADLRWMRASMDWTREANIADATALASLFAAVDACPLAVVGRIHGAALGGGVGLVACCDIAIAADDTRFGFSEVKLGLVPATIAPYVIAKIGSGQTRALFLTGERFDAAHALQIGLVHRVVPVDGLDDAVESVVRQLRSSGPQAIRMIKDLVARLETVHDSSAIAEITAATIAEARVSAEGQEGVHAFLEKRHPSWIEEG